MLHGSGRTLGARFIGRQTDLDTLAERFERARLVTVWATAGMGKTRLALEYGARHRAAGGTFVFCDLSEAHSVDDLLAALGATLDVALERTETDDAIRQLSHAMAIRRHLVVVLDNFEQLVASATEVVSTWLEQAPRVRLLVTSRERLGVEDEESHPLGPLGVPPEGRDVMSAEAVQLFIDRASAYMGEITLDETSTPLVAELVSRLEGIPLAIELAAARVDILGLKGLLARLSERLDALDPGARVSDARQATLRGAISWSWDLLDETEQGALACTSVFQGGFTLEAADAVMALGGTGRDALSVVQSLSDKSLLQRHLHEHTVRFFPYQSVQAFAAEKLVSAGTVERTHQRHADYYLAAGSRWAVETERSGSADALASIASELDNLNAVFERSLAAPDAIDAALAALLSMKPVLTVQRPLPGQLALLDRALSAAADASPSPALLAAALRARGNARRAQGKPDRARGDLSRALELAEGATEGAVLADLGVLEQQHRHLDEAKALYLRALPILVEADAQRDEGRVLGNLGAVHHDLGEFDDAKRNYRRALGVFGEVGDRRLEGIFLANLGVLEVEREELSEARTHFRRGLEILEAVGDKRLVAITLGNMGTLSHTEGDLSHARRCHEDAMALLREVGDLRSEGFCLGRLGAVVAAAGDVDTALAHIDAGEVLLERLGDTIGHAAVTLSRGFVDLAEAALARVRGDEDALRGRFAAVTKRIDEASAGSPSLVEQSDDARTAIRILSGWLEQLDPSTDYAESLPADALLVGPDAQWCRPPDEAYQDLSRKRAARGILAALVDHHQRARGQAVSADVLIAAGWPGESIVPSAGTNRLHVALNQLRKLGLKPHLLREDTGYLLDPTVKVQRVTTDWRSLDTDG
jgi:predicted ATPase/Tfp pilus assembly protein PilF